jgi:hypothetical protein
MGDTIINFQEVLARRFKREQAEARRRLNRITQAEQDMPNAVIMEAARREDTVFVSAQDTRLKGMKMLQGHPRHGLLTAVFNDAIQDFYEIRYGQTTGGINERSFWTFPDRPRRAYFVAPAHVCRSFDTALNLYENGADFRLPDSEGHLPLYFLSQYAEDPLVIPYLARTYHLNGNDSGHWQNAEFPDKAVAYDPPIFRAIKYGNRNAVKGLDILPRHQIDMNLTFTTAELTPLIYAVMMAEQQMEKRSGLFNRLAIVKHLAASPFVDPNKMDATGWNAADYAVSPIVSKVLKQGLNSRKFDLSL